ncbi:MAG: ferrous iron transport protein A [Breznakia sp.]
MPLALAPLGKEVKVIKYSLESNVMKHLHDLGLFPGATVVVVKENGGDVIVQVKESRIALNKQIAKKIIVS